MSADVQPSKSFWYPEHKKEGQITPPRRMCAAGQRRAVYHTMQLYREHYSGVQTDDVTMLIQSASRTTRRLQRGENVDKVSLIIHQVVAAYVNGDLPLYVSPAGDFTLQAHDGTMLPRNIFEELRAGKQLYKFISSPLPESTAHRAENGTEQFLK